MCVKFRIYNLKLPFWLYHCQARIFHFHPKIFFRMILIGRTVIVTAIIASFYFVSDTEQHWKSHKSYSWDGPPKYLHTVVIKSPPPPPLPSTIYLPSDEKPFKSADNCELRKVVFTQGADSPQVNIGTPPVVPKYYVIILVRSCEY